MAKWDFHTKNLSVPTNRYGNPPEPLVFDLPVGAIPAGTPRYVTSTAGFNTYLVSYWLVL